MITFGVQVSFMRYSFYVIIALSLCLSTNAQYYYHDLVNVQNSRQQYLLYKSAGVKTVDVSAINDNGNPADGFWVKQQMDASKRLITTLTASNFTGNSILTTFYDQDGYPLLVVDSADGSNSKTTYTYDAQKKLIALTSTSIMPEQSSYSVNEQHLYYYDAAGKPTSMLRIANNTDTTEVLFIYAENGLPGVEKWVKNSVGTATWYYYYDANNRITDIVKYYSNVKKMLPEYLFQYNDNGQFIQQINSKGPGSGYRIWQYTYNQAGLKSTETVKNKNQQIEARLQYTYRQ